MRSTTSISYPASIERVLDMLSDPEYQRTRLDRVSMRNRAQVSVARPESGAFTVTITASVGREQLASRLPSAALRFLPATLNVTLSEAWQAASSTDEHASRNGSVTFTCPMAPVKAGATCTLASTGDQSSTMTVESEVSVSVPLIGRTIEQKVASQFDRLIRDEERRAAAWLASH